MLAVYPNDLEALKVSRVSGYSSNWFGAPVGHHRVQGLGFRV